MSGEFHWTHGITFQRFPNGAVHMKVGGLWFTIPAAEWASIVAHVSARGGDADTYHEFERFHNKPRQAETVA